MYVVGVYDVNVKRVTKVKKVFDRYMYWVQNSTFEGNLTRVQLRELKTELNKILDPTEDHVIFYEIRNEDVVNKTYLGNHYVNPSNIL